MTWKDWGVLLGVVVFSVAFSVALNTLFIWDDLKECQAHGQIPLRVRIVGKGVQWVCPEDYHP